MMNEFRRKLLDFKTDDKSLILNAFNDLIQHTIDSKDAEFDECLTDIGRFVVCLISAQRISFKILHPQVEENETLKYEAVS